MDWAASEYIVSELSIVNEYCAAIIIVIRRATIRAVVNNFLKDFLRFISMKVAPRVEKNAIGRARLNRYLVILNGMPWMS